MKISSIIVEEWRDVWSYKVDFLMCGIAYLVATTNLLNLPKLILENGGLAFVSAYGAALLVVVLPIIVLEMSVGQITGRGPVKAFYNICPAFKGVGVAQILLCMLALAYMTRFLGWLLLYAFHLFWSIVDERPGLPWLHCKNYPEFHRSSCREAGSITNFTNILPTKLSTLQEQSSLSQYMNALENPSNSITEFGNFQFYLLGAQGAVWIMVFFAVCFGVRWLGKIIHITFLIPFSLFLGLVFRSLTLQGSTEMLEKVYHLTNWNVLEDYTVWKLAVEQAILATGIGFGSFITMASYNKRTNNLVADSFIMVSVHALISFLQVVCVFGFIGFVSSKTGLAPIELLDKGETQMWHLLTYMSYLYNTKLWTGFVLFIVILTLLSIFYLLTLNILSTVEDALGEKSSKCLPRFILALFVCTFCFATSLYFSTQAGKFAYELTAGYLRYYTLWIILACELIAISWCYCAHSLGKDLRVLLKPACCWCLGHFILFFTYLLPAVPIAIAVLNIKAYNFEEYSPQIKTWQFSQYVGFLIASLPLLPIPLFAFFTVCCNCCRSKNISRCERLKESFRSPLRYDLLKNPQNEYHQAEREMVTPPKYAVSAPGYTLLSPNATNHAPLANSDDL
uniref:Transporter n=1 Tax=Rhabditophanes sp. KR3021 TaxID=114890 RepID=A0AC35THA3_9BILA